MNFRASLLFFLSLFFSSICCMENNQNLSGNPTWDKDTSEVTEKNKKHENNEDQEDQNFFSYNREKHNPVLLAFVAGGLCVYLYNKLFPSGVILQSGSGTIASNILEKFVNIKIISSGSGTINLNFPEAAKINICNALISGSGCIYLNGKKF